MENWNYVMSIYQSSLFIDIELALAEAHKKSENDSETPPGREDVAYCFGRIVDAARGTPDKRPDAEKPADSGTALTDASPQDQGRNSKSRIEGRS